MIVGYVVEKKSGKVFSLNQNEKEIPKLSENKVIEFFKEFVNLGGENGKS